MENTTNYDLKLYEGSDKFNPLNVDVPNFETIDEVMKANETAGVQPATELVSGTVHEITRSNADAQVFRFVATAKWELGDSMSIDGTPVTVLLPSGKSIPDGAYVIGVLVGTNCTLYLSETGGTAEDSEKLGGELPSYYATASALENTNTVVTAQGQLITGLNTQINNLYKKVWENATPNDSFSEQTITIDLSEYDYVDVVLAVTPGNAVRAITERLFKTHSKFATQINSLTNYSYRELEVLANGVRVGNGYDVTTSTTVNNGRLRPLKIYAGKVNN